MRLLRVLAILLVLSLVGLAGYAYFGDMAADPVEVRVPVKLDLTAPSDTGIDDAEAAAGEASPISDADASDTEGRANDVD